MSCSRSKVIQSSSFDDNSILESLQTAIETCFGNDPFFEAHEQNINQKHKRFHKDCLLIKQQLTKYISVDE